MNSHILLVDDDKNLLEVVKSYLIREDSTFELATVTSAQEALIRLEKEHYDIIVSDYLMPGMDGLELLEKLRKEGNNVPFIIFTGQGREEVAIRALNLGADYYLKKEGGSKSLYQELTHIIQSIIRHKETEKALRESEERFSKTFHSSPQVIIISQFSNDVVLEVNEACEETLGYRRDQLVGYRVAEVGFTRQEDYEQLKQALRDHGHFTNIEVSIFPKSGEKRVGMASGELIQIGGEKCFLWITNDITEHKRMDEALQASEEKFRQIFNEASDGIAFLDSLGRILDVNKKVVQLFGAPKEELLGKHFTKIGVLHPRNITGYLTNFSKILAGKKTVLDVCIKNRQGKERDLECSASVIEMENRRKGVSVVVRDVTERKRAEEILQKAHNKLEKLVKQRTTELVKINEHLTEEIAKHQQTEEALREREHLYRALFDRTNDAVFIISLDLIHLAVNQRAADMLGYSVKELIGMSTAQVVVPEEFPDSQRAAQALIDGKHAPIYQRNFRRKDGRTIPVELNVALVKDAEGNPLHIQSIARNIAERKQAEEALQKSHDELEELVKKRTDLLVKTNEQLKRENAERRQVEDALRESEQKYRGLVEKLHEGVLTEDTEGTITFANPRAADLLGYSMRELIGQHLSITVPEGELKKIKEEKAKRVHGISSTYETTLLSKDGQLIPVIISATPLLGSNGTYRGTLSVFMDISDVKQAELALQESQEQYRELVEKMQEGVLVEDAEGTMVFVNPKTAEMLGYSTDELIGRPAISIVPEAYKAKIREETAKRKDGFVSTYEAALLTKDEHIIPVIIHATPLFSENQEFRGVLAVFTDITDRKRVEETLERERRAFQIMAEAAIHADTIQDLCQRILIGVVEIFNFDFGIIRLYEENEKLLRPMATVGLSETEANEKILPERLDNVNNVAAHVARTKQAIFAPDIYQHNIHQSHKSRLEEFNVRSLISWPIIGTRQNLLGTIHLVGRNPKEIIEKDQIFFATMVGLFSTVLERKQAETQLKRQKAELSEFVHAMSHDIRNRLLSIEGYASLLENEYNKTYAERTRRLAQDMNDLLRRSVELADAGLIIGEPELLDLTQIVKNVARAVIPENISFLQDDLPIVSGDREKLLQVFQNLFENAIMHGIPTTIEVRQQNGKNGINILVINDGKPIQAEDREKIFQRGFTTKDEGKGLGLTIVQKLIEAHGWRIALEPSTKTTFRIFIPYMK